MSKKILLVCGGGTSSGFLAANIRKAAKRAGYDYEIQARSESEIDNYINDLDMLLVGPHLAYLFDKIKIKTDAHNIPAEIMDQEDYGMLDGDAILERIVTTLEGEK